MGVFSTCMTVRGMKPTGASVAQRPKALPWPPGCTPRWPGLGTRAGYRPYV